MRIKADTEERLVKLFGSFSRVRILGFLFSHTGRTFYQREIMYETGLSLQTVQRELMVKSWCRVYTFHKGKSGSVSRIRGQTTFLGGLLWGQIFILDFGSIMGIGWGAGPGKRKRGRVVFLEIKAKKKDKLCLVEES